MFPHWRWVCRKSFPLCHTTAGQGFSANGPVYREVTLDYLAQDSHPEGTEQRTEMLRDK